MVWLVFPSNLHSEYRKKAQRSLNTDKIEEKNESFYIGGNIKENKFPYETRGGEHGRKDSLHYGIVSSLGTNPEIVSSSPLINAGFFPVYDRSLLEAWDP